MYIFCYACNRNVVDKCKKSGKRLSACKYPEKQCFQTKKTINGRTRPFPGSTMPTTLRDFKEYDRIHAELMRQEATVISINERPMSLKHCLQMFNDDANDKGRESWEKHNYSPDWIQKIYNRSKTILEILKENGCDPSYISVANFHNEYITILYDELTERYAPKTFNHYLSLLNSFFDIFLIDRKKYDIKNPFRQVNYAHREDRTEIIELEWFEKLIEVTTPENGIRDQGSRTRNLYNDELIDFWKLALYTGRRPQDVPYLQVCNILDTYGYCFEQKTARSKKNLRLFILSEELREFKKQQLEKYNLGENDYLVSPFKENRREVQRAASLGFTHFWTLTGYEHRILYDLRNTYATHARMVYGSELEGAFKMHAKIKTTDEKYTNAKKLAEEYKGVRLYG